MTEDQQITKLLHKDYLSEEDLKFLENYEPNDGRDALYSFFTPVWLCEVMVQLAIKNGFNPSGKVLEPSCGHGNMLVALPKESEVTAFETSYNNAEIAKKRKPSATIHQLYFEQAFLQPPRYTKKIDESWLPKFDLVIGNPPYGKFSGKYAHYFKNLKFKQVEQFFMYKSMELLKTGGLLVFITGSNFLRNNLTYNREKQMIGEMAEFVDAYRMPKVFKNTQVPTDIIILKKK